MCFRLFYYLLTWSWDHPVSQTGCVTYTPATAIFSVNEVLLCFLQGHANFLCILSYGIDPVLSPSFQPSLCSIRFPIHDLLWQYVPEPCASSFLDNKFKFLQCCIFPDVFISDVILPRDSPYQSPKRLMCRFHLFFLLPHTQIRRQGEQM